MTSSDCNRCQLYSGSLYLPCAVHPTGPTAGVCLDFAPNAAAALEEDDELWFPDRFGWHAGEPVPGPPFIQPDNPGETGRTGFSPPVHWLPPSMWVAVRSQ